MSFEDLQKTVAGFISQAPTSEAFYYRTVVNGMAGSWQGITGHVLPGNPDNDRMIGTIGRKQQEPIRVAFSRDQISDVNEGEDQVMWNGNIYRVQADLHPADGAWWVLYCTR
jgi:hypothetical protein